MRQYIYLVLFLSSCSTLEGIRDRFNSSNSDIDDTIYVKSFGIESNKKPLQFFDGRYEKESLESYVNRKNMNSACKKEAIRHDYRVNESKELCADCYIVLIYPEAQAKEKVKPVTTVCNNVFGTVICSTHGGGRYVNGYYKTADFSVAAKNSSSQKFEEVRNVKTGFPSEIEEYTDRSRELLCRGFFIGLAGDTKGDYDLPTREELTH